VRMRLHKPGTTPDTSTRPNIAFPWRSSRTGRAILRTAIGSAVVLAAILIPQAANPLVCGLGAVSWDEGGDGTQWTDPLNWDNDTVPGPTDDVCIDTGTPITVNVLGTQAVQSLVSTDNIVINSSNSLTLTNQSEISGDLSLGGTLDGGADLGLTGTTTWTRGRLDGTVTNFGTVNSTGTPTRTIGGAFTNDSTGVFRHTGTGDLFLDARPKGSGILRARGHAARRPEGFLSEERHLQPLYQTGEQQLVIAVKGLT